MRRYTRLVKIAVFAKTFPSTYRRLLSPEEKKRISSGREDESGPIICFKDNVHVLSFG